MTPPAPRDPAALERKDTYEAPKHGWTCFHCGETFTTPGAARDHFGAAPENIAGCLIDRVALEEGGKPERGRGLLMALRKAEQELETLRALADDRWAIIERLTKQHNEWKAQAETLRAERDQARAEVVQFDRERSEAEAKLAALETALRQIVSMCDGGDIVVDAIEEEAEAALRASRETP